MATSLTQAQIDELANTLEERKQGIPRVREPKRESNTFFGMAARAQEEGLRERRRAAADAAARREAEEAEQAIREAARLRVQAETDEQLRVQAITELDELAPRIAERALAYQHVDRLYAELDNRWGALAERVQLLRKRAVVAPLRKEL